MSLYTLIIINSCSFDMIDNQLLTLFNSLDCNFGPAIIFYKMASLFVFLISISSQLRGAFSHAAVIKGAKNVE